MNLSDKIKQILTDRGWTQTRLASSSGLDPSVLSRLLGGERTWRKEHVACVAAALSMTPDALVDGTEVSLTGDAKEVDAEFVLTITKAHGTLVAENSRLSEELAICQQQARDAEAQSRILAENLDELRLTLDREKRAHAVAEAEKRAAEQREVAVVRELSSTKSELALLRSQVDTLRQQLAAAQAAHGAAVEVANRNYAIAKALEQKLSVATGIATVGGIFGLTMLVGSPLSNSKCPKTISTKRRRSSSRRA